MNKNLQAGLGILLALMGAIWSLQGLDVIKGSSVMSGKALWAVIGLIVAVIGALLVVRAVRTKS